MKILSPIIILITVLIFTSCTNKVDYKYIGSFNYETFNDSLHNYNSHLSLDSYGYVIGDLNLQACGIEIFNTEKLDSLDDYIISINHPVESVFDDSDKIKGEGQEHVKRKPLDIVLNKNITTDSIYIYLLKPKGKYRLLLP